MDFESPDVEKDFPGLYASESIKRSQSRDSDFSDEEKTSRKDLLGKRREKRESKKDKGYVAFEGESSGDEVDETRSPGKSKKNKTTFKFSRQKNTNVSLDKKERHARVKEGKEKKEEREKEKLSKKGSKEIKKDKENKDAEQGSKKIKGKKLLREHRLLKIKDKKKKNADQELTEEKPIFGVSLQIAVERSKSHDGIQIPVVVRECIDYIEEHGLACEGIYRISGVKSKLRQLKTQYNRGEKVYLYEHEPHIVASLLKQFLRDLPEPILTLDLTPKFEEAAALKNEQKKYDMLEKLLDELPECNRLLLAWIFLHMLHVVNLERRNKMNLQNVSIVLSPTMQISHRVLHALFAHSDRLFRGVEIKKYVPPIELDSSRLSLELPDSPSAIEEELFKQENFLNKLHAELNTGLRDEKKEEQLWEIQRVVTQLKRKFRFLRQVQDASKTAPEEVQADSKNSCDEFCINTVIQQTTEPKLAPVVDSCIEKIDKTETVEMSMDVPNLEEKIPNSGVQVLNPEVQVLNPEVQVLNPEVQVQNSEVQVQNSEVQVQNSEVQVLNPEVQVLNPEVQVLNTQVQVLNPEVQVLNPEVQVLNPEVQVLKPEVQVLKPEALYTNQNDDIQSSTTVQLSENMLKSDTDIKQIDVNAIEKEDDKAASIQEDMTDLEVGMLSKESTADAISTEKSPIIESSEISGDTNIVLSLLREEVMLQIQRDELMLLGDELRRKVNSEKLEIERLRLEINEYQQLYKYKQYSFDSTENSSSDSDDSSISDYDDEEEDLVTILEDLMKENNMLEKKNLELSEEIQREREICLNIKVQMKMLHTEAKNVRS